MNCPTGTSFFFEVYHWAKEYDKLKDYIIDNVSSIDGTQTTLGIHYNVANNPKL